MTSVIFRREHKQHLEFSAVYVADTLLPFVNDEVQLDLEAGRQYDIYWRIMGPTGSSLVVTKSRGGEDPLTIVDSAIRASDKGRRRDFTLFTA